MQGDTEHAVSLSIEDVSRIHFTGGSSSRHLAREPDARSTPLEAVVDALAATWASTS